MNELQIVVQQVPGTIEINFPEIKDALEEKMSLYKDAKFSEEYKTQAKKEVAALRKIRKAIDDKRKEVKEQCMVPYREFEEKAKELIALVDEPICLIDSQIKEMEVRRIAERKKKIKEIYEACSTMDNRKHIVLEARLRIRRLRTKDIKKTAE